MNGILIAVGIAVVLVLMTVLIWHLALRQIRPGNHKLLLQQKLNGDLEKTGFAYDLQGDYFYSQMDCWQRNMGYCRLYDEGAHLTGMVIDCEPVTFSFGGKNWLIEFRKGQYGAFTGAEAGVYNTRRGEINTEEFHGTFYEAVSDGEMFPISFVLKKNRRTLLKRADVHWWLTGFKLGEYSEPDTLTMDVKLKFPDRGMCLAFVRGLGRLGYLPYEYTVIGNVVKVHVDRPHSVQPVPERSPLRALVQQINEDRCDLYKVSAAGYKDNLGKMEYIKTGAPDLYDAVVNSLYAKGLYEAFDRISSLAPCRKD